MKYLLQSTILIWSICFFLAFSANHPEAKLEFEKYCTYFKYPYQKYEVTTEDGYILTVFRIQKKNTQIQ